MGVTIREKKPGEWWMFVSHNRRRFSKKVGDKKAAQKLQREAQEALNRGDLGLIEETGPPPLTFAEYAETWLDHVAPTLSPSTFGDYKGSLKNYLVPALGPKPLAGIVRDDVKAMALALRSKGLKPKTVKKHVGTLSSLFTDAIDDGKAGSNPTANLRKFYRSAEMTAHREIQPLTRDELAHLLETAQGHADTQKGRTVYPFRQSYPFLLLLARTGLRLGEALALQWGDVDFHGGFLEVRRAFVRGRIKRPKNGKGRRVDLSQQTRDMLADLRDQRFGKPSPNVVALAGRKVPDPPDFATASVFPDSRGGIMDGDNLRRRVWGPLLEAAKLRHFRIHDLRHTYASLLIEARKELHYIQQQLGHHSPAFTLSTYGHLLPRDRRGEVDCLDDASVCTPGASSEKATSAA